MILRLGPNLGANEMNRLRRTAWAALVAIVFSGCGDGRSIPKSKHDVYKITLYVPNYSCKEWTTDDITYESYSGRVEFTDNATGHPLIVIGTVIIEKLQ